MRFLDVPALSPAAVLRSRHQPQMLNIHARPIETNVINSQAFSDWPVFLNPHGTMSQLWLLESRKTAPPVALTVSTALVFNAVAHPKHQSAFFRVRFGFTSGATQAACDHKI